MSESKPLVKLQRMVLMSEYTEDMAAAAQQLMQLSDEDSSSSNCISISNSNSNSNCISIGNNSNGDDTKIRAKGCKRLFDQEQISHHQDEITSAVIEEIFGKEEEILRPSTHKKRRYRFLESIYRETKPIKVSYGKNIWY